MSHPNGGSRAGGAATSIGFSGLQLFLVCFLTPVFVAALGLWAWITNSPIVGLAIVGEPLFIVVGVANYFDMRQWGVEITPAALEIRKKGSWLTGGPTVLPWASITGIEKASTGIRVTTIDKTYRSYAPCRRYLGVIPDPAFDAKLDALKHAWKST